MPIRPENKDRYPKDWKAIRARILTRAHNHAGWPCCEGCGVANYAKGYWLPDGEFEDTGGMDSPDGEKIIKIVLTVAHLDHQPENCDDTNLKAWCQRCHNRYDMPMRRQGIKERQRSLCASGDLLIGVSE